MSRSRVAGLVLLTAVACGEREAPANSVSEAASREAAALLEVLATDPALAGLEDVEDVIRQGLPVRAARLLEVGVQAAADRQVARVGAVEVTDDEVRSLKREAHEALQSRSESLREYRNLLERGRVEDLALVECLGEQRQAATRLSDVMRSLDAYSPSD